jgi:phosphatidylglycerophosphate synthase
MLARSGVRPNAVSVASVGCALIAGAALALSPGTSGAGRGALLIAAAVGIQLRLLCNLLDGMLAVEEGLKSRTGEIFNELPDRIADVLILVGAGYALPDFTYGPAPGWAAAVAALLTAYVRTLSGALGLTQHFVGPMAKQHRMFTLTLATLVAAIEAAFDLPARAIGAGLAVILAGSVVTVMRRTRRLLRDAEGR